jgi:hypothetical protein
VGWVTARPLPLTVTASRVGDASVLQVCGLLDSTTYLPLRDSIINAALEEPRAVIVDIADLIVPAESALAVFTSARWHVHHWPDIPIVLVSACTDTRDAVLRHGVSRYVPLYPSVADALGALAGPPKPHRRRARAELPADAESLGRSRDLVTQWLTTWSQDDLVPVAKVIVTAFVENVLKHTDSQPDLRVETDGAAVTVAVADSSRAAPEVRENRDGEAGVCGLQVVFALTRTWGTAPTPTGKTVWAVIGRENRL